MKVIPQNLVDIFFLYLGEVCRPSNADLIWIYCYPECISIGYSSMVNTLFITRVFLGLFQQPCVMCLVVSCQHTSAYYCSLCVRTYCNTRTLICFLKN